MKTITAAIQAILDADENYPITAVVITLNDGTILRVADRSVTIDGHAYDPDLKNPPRLIVDGEKGIDNTALDLNNADWGYSAYDNQDLFDGARVTVSQYFATDSTYMTFEGPILTFSGVISQPTSSGSGILSLTVLADARVSEGGSIGRTLTGRCLNTFGDANCGYVESGTIATGGTYVAGAFVPLSETLLAGQCGNGFVALRPSTNTNNRVLIKRAGVVVYGEAEVVRISGANFASKSPGQTGSVSFNIDLTLLVGDKIVYATCPRDSALNCALRWDLGNATRQQDKWMGFDYLRGGSDFSYVTDSRYEDALGHTVPIAYGQRWVEPLLIGVHQNRKADGDPAWQSDRKGPFVVALLSEGPVDQGVVDPDTDVELDGKLAKDTADYHGGVGDALDVKTGTAVQIVSDLAPTPIALTDDIPALSAMRGVAYAILDLPDAYDVGQVQIDLSSEVAFTGGVISGGGDLNGGAPDALVGRRIYKRTIFQPKKPALRLNVRGRLVYTWSYVGDVPTKSGSPVFSTNPFWQILDLLSAPQRVAESDIFSAFVSESELDLASFIDAAAYADENITVFDSHGDEGTVARYVASLYNTSPNRADAIQPLLDLARASLVFRRGKIGVVCDAPLGGKGTATSGTVSSLVDSRRGDAAFPTVPTWPDGGLVGLKIKILAGTGAGQVRTLASNTPNSVVPTVNFSPAPDATSEYAIYAVEISVGNSANVSRKKALASHAIPNKVLVNFEADEFRGRQATLPVIDSVLDGQGNTHSDRFGLNEITVQLTACTTFQQAARHGWYVLRRGLDTNRLFSIEGVNIEGMPIEVGDLVLFSHDVDGVENEMVRVERVEDNGDGTYTLSARLYREHIHVDWPTGDVDGLDISSNLINPHSVPPHVQNVVVESERESSDSPPLMVVSYDLPQWPYAGWAVLIEARYKDAEEDWTDWKLMATSRDATASFRAAQLADYEVRAVFISHAGVRADASVVTGTSSGSNTATTLNDTTKHWSTDQFDDLTVAITGGLGVDQERVISANTDTELTVAAWATTPDATSAYKVYAPAEVVSVLVEPADTETTIRLIKLDSDRTRIRFRVVYGSAVTRVALWDREYEQAALRALSELTGEDFARLSEPEDDAADWDRNLFPDDPDDEIIEFAIPAEGRERWETLRPICTGGRKGTGFHFPIYPTGEAADRIVSAQIQVNSVTGAVEIPIVIDPRSSSVRAAYAVGAVGVTAPTDAEVEASSASGLGFTVNIVGSDVIALPANTVGYDQEIVVRLCAYLAEDGLDDKGRPSVHGEIREIRALRQKPPVSLDLEVDDTDPDTGVATVTLRDEAGFTTAIRARRKIGEADWSAPFDVTLAPVNGGEYIVTVTKVERHQSSLEIWAEGTINGAAFRVPVEVPAFDAGRIPNVIVIPKLEENDATGSGTIIGDADTYSTKLVAARNTPPDDSVVDAATPIVGRSVLYTEVGVLVSGLVPGDIVHYAWRGIGPNGENQSAVNRAAVPYHVIAPSIDATTTEEDRGTALATFGVTVHDTAAQADSLEAQVRDNADEWPSTWDLVSSSPTDGMEYTRTVDLTEGHTAQIRFRLNFTIRNKARELIVESPAFDLGKVPRVQIRPILDEDLNLTAEVPCNYDVQSIKIAAAVGAEPSDATVRAATAINLPLGQSGFTPTDIGTLLTADPSDEIYIKVFAYSESAAAGNESVAVVAYIQAATVSSINPRITACDQSDAPFDDGTDLNIDLTWGVLEAPSADYYFDLQIILDGVQVDTVGSVSVTDTQPKTVVASGGSGTAGLNLVVRFLLARASDGVYVDSRDTPVRLTATTE